LAGWPRNAATSAEQIEGLRFAFFRVGDGGGYYLYPTQLIFIFSCFRWRVGRGTRPTSAEQIFDLRFFREFSVMNAPTQKNPVHEIEKHTHPTIT